MRKNENFARATCNYCGLRALERMRRRGRLIEPYEIIWKEGSAVLELYFIGCD